MTSSKKESDHSSVKVSKDTLQQSDPQKPAGSEPSADSSPTAQHSPQSQPIFRSSPKFWLASGGAVILGLLIGGLLHSLKEEKDKKSPVSSEKTHMASGRHETSKDLFSAAGPRPHKERAADISLSSTIEQDKTSLKPSTLSLEKNPPLPISPEQKASNITSPHSNPESEKDPEIKNLSQMLAHLEEKNRAIEERLIRLEEYTHHTAETVKTYKELAASLEAGVPFQNSLNALKHLIPTPSTSFQHHLSILESYAATGVIPLEKLKDLFHTWKTKMTEDLARHQNMSWWEKVKWYLKNSVYVGEETKGPGVQLTLPVEELLRNLTEAVHKESWDQAILWAHNLLFSLNRDDPQRSALETWMRHIQAWQESHGAQENLKRTLWMEHIEKGTGR